MKSYIVATCVDYSLIKGAQIPFFPYVFREDNIKNQGSEHAGVPSEFKNQFHFPDPGLAPGWTSERICSATNPNLIQLKAAKEVLVLYCILISDMYTDPHKDSCFVLPQW